MAGLLRGGRAAAAGLVMIAGLSLVYLSGPLRHRPSNPTAPPVTGITSTVPATMPGGRGLTNGRPFSYKTGISNRAPEMIVSDFKAEGVVSHLVDGLEVPLPPLDAPPSAPGFLTALRWAKSSPDEPPNPEALLVFGQAPATTYQLQLAAPPAASAAYRPLQDLEARLGIVRSGLDVSYGLVDPRGITLFIGQDPKRRLLAPGFSSAMEAAGWRPGARDLSRDQAVACFSRWKVGVCLSRDQSGTLVVSLGAANAILPLHTIGLPVT